MSQSPAYPPSAGPAPSASLGRLREAPWLPSALAGAALLAFAYAPNVLDLATIWENEPNYSHGFLVVPIAAVILWRRLVDHPFEWSPPRVSWLAWGALAAILAARILAYERGMSWMENATLIPAAMLIVHVLGGWELLKRAWPAILFLVFMLPLPRAVNTMVALPLQRIATIGSSFMLQLTGLWVVATGNVITLATPRGPQQLEVAQACNGLSMLMTLAATVTATVTLVPMPTWKRLVVLASALPIALISNVCRIVATGWLYYLLEGELAHERAHDWSGYLMMPLALVLVGSELWLLSWLFDDEEATAARPIGPVAAPRRA